MEDLNRFGHEHPLSLVMDAEEGESICYGCSEKTTLSEATYSCRECRNIFLHKRCADLPREIREYPMHPQHPLLLLVRHPYPSEGCYCSVCKRDCSNFVYHCSSCNFDVDVHCAFSEAQLKIPIHHHPVRLITRSASFTCDACEEDRRDESYICTKLCGFWVHKKCGLMPEEYKRDDHDHPLSLAIYLPPEYLNYKFTCEICFEGLDREDNVYYCRPCRYFVHFKCVMLKAPEPEVIEHPDVCLPGADNDGNVNLLLKQIESLLGVEPSESTEEEKVINVEWHKHPLVIGIAAADDEDETMMICDGCILPISSSSKYYKCGHNNADSPCPFFLHIPCAKSPTELEIEFLHLQGHHDCEGEMFKLHFPAGNAWEVVECQLCHSFCSGFSYKCQTCNFCVDIKCLSLYFPRIQHKAHKHTLETPSSTYRRHRKCTGCQLSVASVHLFLRCLDCKYYLGFECAVLPPTVKHRWDKHPLILSFPPFPDIPDEFFCEVCEEEIHPKLWIYRCAQCDQSFHPRCLPTLGPSRNIKFGRTVEIQRHPHPLTLVPEGSLNSRCDQCCQLLYWQKTFECPPCTFYLCFNCIAKEPLACND